MDRKSIINGSRTSLQTQLHKLKQYNCNILTDELPNLDVVDVPVDCIGSIHLKQISRLGLDDFGADFEINEMGALKGHRYGICV